MRISSRPNQRSLRKRPRPEIRQWVNYLQVMAREREVAERISKARLQPNPHPRPAQPPKLSDPVRPPVTQPVASQRIQGSLNLAAAILVAVAAAAMAIQVIVRATFLSSH